MIEVEKKFALKEGDIDKLIDGAKYLGKVVNHDIYYDTADNQLSFNNIWLRQRNNKFELKVPVSGLNKKNKYGVTRYHELHTDKSITHELKIKKGDSLEQSLHQAGFKPFASYVTNRQKYKKSNFNIFIDNTDFGFQVAEIELLVDTQEDIESAAQKIVKFAKDVDLKIDYVSGKITHYLKKFKPDLYRKLLNNKKNRS
jgi:predicted adenylyl cyclase CyaB